MASDKQPDVLTFYIYRYSVYLVRIIGMANCAWVFWQHPHSTCPPTRAVNLLVPTPKINLSTQVVSLRFISKDIIWAWSSPALFWFSPSLLLVLFSASHQLVGLWSLLSFQCMTSNWPFLPETLICIQFPSLFEPFCGYFCDFITVPTR